MSSGDLVRRIETSAPSLHALAISHDGRLLATGGVTNPISDRSTPFVFDVQSGEKIAELAGQLTTIESLMFHGGQQISSGWFSIRESSKSLIW